MTTDSTDRTGLTAAGTSYTPGSWFGIVGDHATVLLPPSEKGRAGTIWALVDDGAGYDEVLDALVSAGLRTLPGFVLIAETGDGVRVLVRGDASATIETAEGETQVAGSGSTTWEERTFAGVTRMSVKLGEETGGSAHTLSGGLVRLSALEVPPPAPSAPAASAPAVSAAPAPASAPPDSPDSPLVAGPSVPPPPPVAAPAEPGGPESGDVGPESPDGPGPGVVPFAPALSVVPPMPAAVPEAADEHSDEHSDEQIDEHAEEPATADEGEPAEAEEEPRSVWGAPADAGPSVEPDDEPQDEPHDGPAPGTGSAPESVGDDYTPDPLTDPMTDSFSFAKPLAEGDTELPPEESAAESAGAVPPPPPPGFPPPPGMPPAPPAPPAPSSPAGPPPPGWGTPAAEPTDDHDGLTRAGAPMPEMGSRPGIPGQPAAPKVTAFAVARLEFSSGDRVDVDRVVLVGRAPEAGRFTQSDQPLLVTVPSPHQEISSTHCEIRPGTGVDHGAAVVTDLGSTNGTVLVQPGLGPEDLRPGVPVQLIPGAVIDLGDGLTIRVTHP